MARRKSHTFHFPFAQDDCKAKTILFFSFSVDCIGPARAFRIQSGIVLPPGSEKLQAFCTSCGFAVPP